MGCGDIEGDAWLHSIWDPHAKEGMWQFDNSLGAGILAMCNSLTSALFTNISVGFELHLGASQVI